MKWIKNITQNDLIVAGIKIPADSFYQLKGFDNQRFGFNAKLESQIDNDEVLGSKDGITLLSKEKSKKLLLAVNSSEGTVFDDSNVPFTADTVQEAMERMWETPVGGLDLHTFVENSSANNKWLEYERASIPSDESPAILPFDCKLIGCTFTNEDDGVDTDIEVHKSADGNGATASKIVTFEIRNLRVARFTDFTPIEFDAGDKISVFARDQGTNPSAVVVKLYFVISNHNLENSGEDYSSDFSLNVGGITITIGS